MYLRQRNERDAFPHSPILDEILANLLILDYYIEEFTATSNFQSSGFVVMFLCKRDQLNCDSFYLSSIEVRCRVVIVKVESTNAGLNPFAFLQEP